MKESPVDRSSSTPEAGDSATRTFPDAPASSDAAARAFAHLADVLGEIEAGYIGPERGMHTPQERAAGRYLVANALQHGFQCWFGADPRRPLFQRWLSPTKKLLGDNPDAVFAAMSTAPATRPSASRQGPRRATSRRAWCRP
jgi:hypothetical protein